MTIFPADTTRMGLTNATQIPAKARTHTSHCPQGTTGKLTKLAVSPECQTRCVAF